MYIYELLRSQFLMYSDSNALLSDLISKTSQQLHNGVTDSASVLCSLSFLQYRSHQFRMGLINYKAFFTVLAVD